MLRANLRDGRTLSFDLFTEGGTEDWKRRQADPAFQSLLTGISILWDGETFALPVPRFFRKVAYSAEVVNDGERPAALKIGALSDDTFASVTVYLKSPRIVRFDVRRMGKPRHVEVGMPWPQER